MTIMAIIFGAGIAVFVGLVLARALARTLERKTIARHASRDLNDDLKGAAHA